MRALYYLVPSRHRRDGRNRRHSGCGRKAGHATMSDQLLRDAFDSHSFLKDLSERHRMLLASGVRPFSAAPKDVLAKEGELAKYFFLVQSGHVELAIPT